MPGPFSAINTMSSALRAFQRELDVTGHNVANVNTPGFTRQVVNLATAPATSYTEGQLRTLGNGVNVSSVSRVRDMFLQARRQDIGAERERLGAQSDGLAQIEGLVHDPNAKGIGDALNDFFDGWSALASNPNQPAYKLQVQTAATTLTTRVRSAYASLQGLSNEQTTKVGDAMNEINSLGARIADMNMQIRKETAAGGSPNDLLDQRDQAVNQLASLTDVKTKALDDGTVMVSIGGHALVDPEGFNAAATGPIDPVAGTIGTGDNKIEIRSGQIRGLFDTINAVTSAQGRLDRIANTLRTSVNALHQTGTSADGTTGVDFFNDASPQTGAVNFDLSAAVKADPNAIATGATGSTGDGSVALALSKLRDEKSSALGGRTVGEDFSDFVSQVGGNAKAANDNLSTQNALANQVDAQIQSVSGVSIDDEMANMLRFQRSYQAAAKALSVFDSVFDNLLGMIK